MQGGFLDRFFSVSIPAPGANTNIIINGVANRVTGISTATSLQPTVSGSFLIRVTLATASVFNVMETFGATTITHSMEQGQTLVLGCAYQWTFGVFAGCTYNFQVPTNGIINALFVAELQVGVAA